MIVSLVVAMGRNHVIGRDNALPWRLPADLKYFRAVTMGKPVVMGRKTHESIGRPLPGRDNIVISHDPGFRADGCIVLPSLEAAYEHCRDRDEVMVIGGASIYRQALAHTQRIYLTEIGAEFAGDTVFPPLDTATWREVRREDHPVDANNHYPYSFIVLERKTAGTEDRTRNQ
ncbi:MAG: type 3 dihydrofolate reductase [Gammaproteobacteria bacterium]|nr:type 3 dihydrofolate reductase [Gammaproteobacteria bacterium]